MKDSYFIWETTCCYNILNDVLKCMAVRQLTVPITGYSATVDPAKAIL